MSITKSFVALATVAVVGGASAATVPTVWDYTSNTSPLKVSASLDSGATTVQIRTAELFGTNTDPEGSFAAFCLEPTVAAGDFPGFSMPALEISAAVADAYSKIFTGAGWKSWDSGSDAVTTAAQRAAIQLAVWDIAIDGAFNLGSGLFQSTDALAGSAVAFYAAGNTSLASYIYKISDDLAKTTGKQDVIIVTSPIPEPSTYALMIAGIAAVGFVARRRSNRT